MGQKFTSRPRTKELNELDARIRAALMTGNALLFECPKEMVEHQNIDYILGYIMSACGKKGPLETCEEAGKRMMEMATHYISGEYIVRAISTSMLGGEFRCINIVMTTDEDDDPEYLGQWHLDDENGAFGYVANLDAPDLSELGYMFFEKRKNGNYHRIA